MLELFYQVFLFFYTYANAESYNFVCFIKYSEDNVFKRSAKRKRSENFKLYRTK